jgi:hypothetical protein
MSNTNGTKTDKTASESWNKGIFDLESWNEDIFYDEDALSEWTACEESRKQRVEEAAKVCDKLDNYTCHSSKRPTPSQCAFFIRELK